MLFLFKHLIPKRQRQQIRVAVSMARVYKLPLIKVLKSVKLQSVGEVLTCIEDFDARKNGRTTIWVRGSKFPISLRNGTSDFAVFRQVFLDSQYDLPIITTANYIVDAGANIGLASFYFLSKNSHTRVVAVEPDPENVEIAKENLRPFGDRCRLIHGAVWSSSGELALSRGEFRDGRHWATQTIPHSETSSDLVTAYTINQLIREFAYSRVDFVKMDIEGAELQVFRDGDTSFLETIACCAVECHGNECIQAFTAAVQAYGLNLRLSNELHIGERQ